MITVFGVPNMIHCNGGACTTCAPEPTFPIVQLDRNPLLEAAVSPLTSRLIICSGHKPSFKTKELFLSSGLVNVLDFQPFQLLMRFGKRLFVGTLLRNALTPSVPSKYAKAASTKDLHDKEDKESKDPSKHEHPKQKYE